MVAPNHYWYGIVFFFFNSYNQHDVERYDPNNYLGIQRLSSLAIPTKFQYLIATTSLISKGRFEITLYSHVGCPYHAFTSIPDKHRF